MGSIQHLILKKLNERLEDLYGPRLVNVILYGSQARGDADDNSDIDVLVVLKGPVIPSDEIARTGSVTTSLSLDYNVVISCAFVSDLRFLQEQSPFLMNVRREGMPLWP